VLALLLDHRSADHAARLQRPGPHPSPDARHHVPRVNLAAVADRVTSEAKLGLAHDRDGLYGGAA
jgi:hypothetical protein